MGALDFIAQSVNRKDDEPNKSLAREIVSSGRKEWIKELVDNLNHKDKNIQSDCIKVLYETGKMGGSQLIAPYVKDFAHLLTSRNNRLVWGGMIALDTITLEKPAEIIDILPLIMSTIDKGSVITIDCGVSILAKLSSLPTYYEITFPLLIEQLTKCPVKQLPMYSEYAEMAINKSNKEGFIHLLESRLNELEKESQKTRITRTIKRIKKLK